MSERPETRPSLLIALRDRDNDERWRQFVEIYSPMIRRHCLKHGLQEADAADVSQETMRAVVRSMPNFQYDRSRGTFRSWLLTVTRSKLNTFFAARAKQPQASGDTTVQTFLEAQPGPADVRDWEMEYRRRLFEVAAERVRPDCEERTWQAFWRTTVRGEPAGEVARALGQSVGSVYIARSRVLARLRECIESLSDEGETLESDLHIAPGEAERLSRVP